MFHWEAAFCTPLGLERSLLAVGVGQHFGGTLRWPRRRVEKIQGSPWPSSSSHHTVSLQDAAEAAKTADFPFAPILSIWINRNIFSCLTYLFSFYRRISVLCIEEFSFCAIIWIQENVCLSLRTDGWGFKTMPWLSTVKTKSLLMSPVSILFLLTLRCLGLFKGEELFRTNWYCPEMNTRGDNSQSGSPDSLPVVLVQMSQIIYTKCKQTLMPLTNFHDWCLQLRQCV